MVKTITQSTFDDVVKENVDDFEMSLEDAVADAISQFEAQGVDLSNIVTDLTLQSGAGGETTTKHPVIIALDNLTSAVQQNNTSDIINKCTELKTQCDIDLAHRCLAGKNAYETIFKVCENPNEDVVIAGLETMCSLCNGQPDLLNDVGRAYLLKNLNNKTNAKLTALSVKLVRLNCVKHESNRQTFIAEKLIPALMECLETYKDNCEVVREVCFGLRVLTFDDDLRVPFGKAHEHAKMIVTEADALRKILNICKDYSDDKVVLGELFSTLSKLAVRNEFCQEIMDLGGLELMLMAIEKNMDHQGIVIQAMSVMKAIAGNDQVKVAIVKNNGAPIILSAITRHQKHTGVCETGCAALATVALRNPDHCQVIMDANGAEVILKCMVLHPTDNRVQKQACMAVRNIVARTRQHCPPFLELNGEDIIRQALNTHKDCGDEAKAALRDLGCNVELVERWTGTKQGIQA